MTLGLTSDYIRRSTFAGKIWRGLRLKSLRRPVALLEDLDLQAAGSDGHASRVRAVGSHLAAVKPGQPMRIGECSSPASRVAFSSTSAAWGGWSILPVCDMASSVVRAVDGSGCIEVRGSRVARLLIARNAPSNVGYSFR